MRKNGTMKIIKSRHDVAAVFFALMLVISLTGVSAWLADASGTLTNKFEAKTLELDIAETDTHIDGDDDDKTNSYKITFGEEGWDDIIKDPAATLPADQIDCWVFVKLKKSDNFDDFLTYEIADGWTALGDSYPGIYYRSSESSPEKQDFNILKDKTVSVKNSVTKEQINALTEDTYPKLDISGFAIQLSGFDTAQDAWDKIGD